MYYYNSKCNIQTHTLLQSRILQIISYICLFIYLYYIKGYTNFNNLFFCYFLWFCTVRYVNTLKYAERPNRKISHVDDKLFIHPTFRDNRFFNDHYARFIDSDIRIIFEILSHRELKILKEIERTKQIIGLVHDLIILRNKEYNHYTRSLVFHQQLLINKYNK